MSDALPHDEFKRPGFENGQPVPSWNPLEDVSAELSAVLEELGLSSHVEELIEDGVKRRVSDAIACALAELLDPAARVAEVRKRTLTLAYAIGYPGLPPMAQVASIYALKKFDRAAVQKRVDACQALMGLPRSIYQRGDETRELNQKNNRRGVSYEG